MKLREALELLKDFDQEHEVHFVTPADAKEGQLRLMLVSADMTTRATTAHVPPSNVPTGHTTQGGVRKPGG